MPQSSRSEHFKWLKPIGCSNPGTVTNIFSQIEIDRLVKINYRIASRSSIEYSSSSVAKNLGSSLLSMLIYAQIDSWQGIETKI